MGKVFEEIYKIVRKIPAGKVFTYGEIARRLKVSPRLVGNALHQNPNPEKIPCHRVVFKDGRLALGYAFGGAKEQRRKLLLEGVKFKDRTHVDLEKSLWQRLI
jgi:methylated-DNA-protein-cysteine methyltransferase-like protein